MTVSKEQLQADKLRGRADAAENTTSNRPSDRNWIAPDSPETQARQAAYDEGQAEYKKGKK